MGAAFSFGTSAHASCRVCGKSKPHSEFYERQLRAGGDVGECKECTKERVRRRARNNDDVRAYERERAKMPHRQKLRETVTERWNAENPLAKIAHNAVSNAIRDKRLSKEPCLFCGAEKVHAHHRDYARPLEVVWLCPRCHHRLHKTFPETEGASKGV